ncbi:MAG: hypothetical protein R2880_08005 [Deinococcales bacterium]
MKKIAWQGQYSNRQTVFYREYADVYDENSGTSYRLTSNSGNMTQLKLLMVIILL